MSTSIVILNLAILGAVLVNDLGRRRITLRRLVRPLAISAVVVCLFLTTPATSGAGLTLEIAGVATGLAVGAVASLSMRVRRDSKSGDTITDAGAVYAAVWTAIVAARLAFAYSAQNLFGPALGRWLFTNGISAAAFTDAFILFSIAIVVGRTVGITLRARRLEGGAAPVTALAA